MGSGSSRSSEPSNLLSASQDNSNSAPPKLENHVKAENDSLLKAPQTDALGMHVGTRDENLNNSNPSLDKPERKCKDGNKQEKCDMNNDEPETNTSNSDDKPGPSKPAAGTDQQQKSAALKPASTEKRPNNVSQHSGATDRKKSSVEEAQERFTTSLRLSCELFEPKDMLSAVSEDVSILQLSRAPSPHLSFPTLLHGLPNLQVLDLAGNRLGPVGFRSLMYAMCYNSSITAFNMADNNADTDSALSIGKMLSENSSLRCLDISGNYLGIDYFSRCVGPALASNTSLQVLRCESIGSSDVSVLMEKLTLNSALRELNLAHNEISDSAQMVAHLADIIKEVKCVLTRVDVKNCGLKPGDMEVLQVAIKHNTSLHSLNISSNKVSSHQCLMELLVTCMSHPTMVTLQADNIHIVKPGTWKPADTEKLSTTSRLQSLHLSNCSLKDEYITCLQDHCTPGILTNLTQLVLTNNTGLTVAVLNPVHQLLTGGGATCCPLEELSYGQNTAEDLPELLASGLYPNLRYLNLRKARISGSSVGRLSGMVQDGLTTLVLDGIKLSGTDAIKLLLGDGAFLTSGSSSMSLNAFSLSGCQLTDKDLVPLVSAIGHGLPLHMLKVSGNRLTDTFMSGLVDSLLAQPGHPLSLVDISGNKLKQAGAEKLAEALQAGKLNLRNLNVSSNSIDPEGISALVSALASGSLITLQASSQQVNYEEQHMEDIYGTLLHKLGLEVERDGDRIKPASCAMPDLPTGFQCKLLGLGGCPGEIGQMLDSAAICTDFQKVKKTQLTLLHATQLAAHLKGQASGECLVSGEEWNNIISADKDAPPSWLQLADSRRVAIYLSGLPASISIQKLEGFLEMEVDCGVQEVFLCKDILTRKNNGFAWVLLSDTESVDKAVKHFQTGEAVVLGTSFVMSAVQVAVDDDVNSQSQANARKDMEARMKSRQKEDQAHRHLIEDSYYTSQKRHAYRLAHPAYADGRIW